MQTIELVTSILVLAGSLFMGAAIIRGRKIGGQVLPELRRRWHVMIVLMFFFLIGYLFFFIVLTSGLSLPTEVITGPVFLAGAVFVFIVISLTRDTIGRIRSTEEALQRMNESLEQRVVERTRELQVSREFLRTVLDSLNDQVIIIDVNDFTIMGANAAFLAECGLPAEQVIGRKCHEITHGRADVCTPPDDICPLIETVKTGRHFTTEHVHYTKEGKKIYVEVSASPIKDSNGNVVQVVHVSKDISEKRRAEETLQESEQRYRMLFERAGDAIFILEAGGTQAGTIVAANTAAADVHGFTVDELVGKNITALDVPDDSKSANHMIQRMVSGEWIKTEMRHFRKNGTVFPVEVSAGLLELGNHKYILAFDRDITERKVAEQKLLQTQQTLQTILSSTPYGVVIMGMDKRVRSANKAALELMGYDSEEQIAGRICNQSFCPTEEEKCPIIDLHGTVNQAEKTLITKDGRRLPILKTVVPIEIDGECVLLEAFIDITEQKNAERKLEHYAAELKQSNDDVLSFAYIVSHDLRAPLVSIKGFAGELQLAMKKIEAAIDACMSHMDNDERLQIAAVIRGDVPEAMKYIDSSVNRMDRLINAILMLSRAGQRELKPEMIDMKELTSSILSSFAHRIEQRKTIVSIGELPVISADRLAIEQIMGNLLDNSLKYLDPVREGRIGVSAEQNEEEIIFHISDNGRGIASGDLMKVFELFRRSGKQDVPGEGMGLAHVKTLVRRQGGRIWCESELGKGTTFSFTITLSGSAVG